MILLGCVCLGFGEALAIAAIVTACGGGACALAAKAKVAKPSEEPTE